MSLFCLLVGSYSARASIFSFRFCEMHNPSIHTSAVRLLIFVYFCLTENCLNYSDMQLALKFSHEYNLSYITPISIFKVTKQILLFVTSVQKLVEETVKLHL